LITSQQARVLIAPQQKFLNLRLPPVTTSQSLLLYGELARVFWFPGQLDNCILSRVAVDSKPLQSAA
jgi:hypothetical protein